MFDNNWKCKCDCFILLDDLHDKMYDANELYIGVKCIQKQAKICI